MRGEQGCQMAFFSNQKFRIWLILEGHDMENVDLFHGHLEYFTAIWYILWPFA
jgi:hypothetical protein